MKKLALALLATACTLPALNTLRTRAASARAQQGPTRARRRLVPRAVARIPLGRRPHSHGAGAHPLHPRRRVRLVHHGTLRGQLPSSTGLSTPSASPRNTTSPSSSARPRPRRPRGSRRSTPKPSAPCADGRKDEHGGRQQFDWSDPKVPRALPHHRHQTRRALRSRPQRHRLADRQRVRRRQRRRRQQSTLRRMAARQVQDARQPQHPLDHRLLVADLQQLEPDQHPDTVNARRKPRPQSRLARVRLRHLAQLPAQPARRHPRPRRQAPVHHHQHDGLVRRLRPIHRRAGSRPRLLGRLRRHRPAQSLDENGARHDLTRGFLRKNFWVMETQPGFVNWSPNNNALNKGEVRAMAWQRHRPRLRSRRVLAVAQRAQRAGAVSRHARRRRRHCPCRSTPKSNSSAPTSTKPAPRSPAPPSTPTSLCSTTTPHAGPSTGSATTRPSIPSRPS